METLQEISLKKSIEDSTTLSELQHPLPRQKFPKLVQELHPTSPWVFIVFKIIQTP